VRRAVGAQADADGSLTDRAEIVYAVGTRV
jgi:hypothetical protein